MSTRPFQAMILAFALGSMTAPLTRADEPANPDPKPAPAPAPETPTPPAPTPDKADTPADEKPADEKLPSLDELLGLDNPVDDRTKGLLEDYDPDKVQLDRLLTAEEAAEKLQQAVQQMHETAFRLEQIRDTGIVTQRLQAEVLNKLDVLIKNAESQQQSSGKSSSNSKSSQQQQQQQAPPKPQPGEQQQGQNQAGAQEGGGNPPFQEGQRDQLEAARAAWGALPERVRDRLMEGSNDYFSEWYKALTEAYYKRIAEEATK